MSQTETGMVDMFAGTMHVPPRPKALTDDQRRVIAADLVDRVIKTGTLGPSDRDEAIEDVIKATRWCSDGYEIAKALDDDNGWMCDAEVVAILDDFGVEKSGALRESVKAWVVHFGIAARFLVGQRIIAYDGTEQAFRGVVDDIRAEFAEYAVKIDGDPRAEPPTNSRRIVAFEDCVAARLDDQAEEAPSCA